MNIFNRSFIVSTASALLAASFAMAQDWDAGGDGSSWEDNVNWGGDNEPTLGTLARINLAGGSDVFITQSGEVADRFIIGQGASGVQNLTISSGSLTTDSGTDHRIGQISEGNLTITGGSLNLSVGGYSSDSGSTFTISGGTVSINGGSSYGSSSAGTLSVIGSGATSIDYLNGLTAGASSTTAFTLDAGAVTTVDVAGTYNINAAAQLIITAGSGFAGGAGPFDLVTFGSVGGAGAFDPANITLSGLRGTVGIDGDSLFISDVSVIPEPSTLALLGIGGLALVLRRRLGRA